MLGIRVNFTIDNEYQYLFQEGYQVKHNNNCGENSGVKKEGKNEKEKYNDGGAFKVTARNENGVVVSVEEDNERLEIPKSYHLSQNYPNPFNPSTKIRYSIPVNSQVKLKIYDMLGREVAILVDESKPKGIYSINFDGSNLPSGVYYYSLSY